MEEKKRDSWKKGAERKSKQKERGEKRLSKERMEWRKYGNGRK
jgi:hypothetical protein